jgi:hypothetical protein
MAIHRTSQRDIQIEENSGISFLSSHTLIAAGGGGGENVMSSYLDDNNHFTAASSSSPLSTKQRILNLSNELLDLCNADPNNHRQIFLNNSELAKRSLPLNSLDRITSVKQLNSTLYVYFFECICDTELVDKKWPPQCHEDEIHNVQTIIDTLSLDILHEDLSHLTGEAICGSHPDARPDIVSIEYLLDILRCIHEWISSRIESTNCSLYSNQNKNQSNDKNNHNNNKIELEIQTSTNDFVIDDNEVDQKYTEVSKKFEETVKMTDDALNDSNPMDLIDLIETLNSKNNDLLRNENQSQQNHEEDIFKRYMREKEHEYYLGKQTCSQNQNSTSKNARKISPSSTSGHSSFCSSSSSSIFSLSNSQKSNNNNKNNNNQGKHVKFMVSSVSNHQNESIVSSTVPTERNKRTNSHVAIQSVDNEIKTIRSILNQKLHTGQSQIEQVLKSVYSEDLKDAQSIIKCTLNKAKRNSDIARELLQNAYELDKQGKMNGPINNDRSACSRPRSSLTVSKTSKYKGKLFLK